MSAALELLRRRGWVAAVAAVLLAFGDRLALPQPRPDRLRFSHTFTSPSEQAIVNDAIAEFERLHPGVRVDQVISNSQVYNTVGWRTQFQGRIQPDVYFQWEGDKVDRAVARGWALDVAPLLDPEFVASFVPAAFDRGGPSEPIYFLPHSVDLCNLVWYDRDAFEALGLTPPGTLEAWLEQSEALRRQGRLALGQGNRDLWPMGNLAAELLAQDLGAQETDRLYAPGLAVSPADLAGLEPLVWLRQRGCFELPGTLEAGGIGALGDTDAKVLFLSGKAAQHVVGSWFLADVRDARRSGELKFRVDLFPVPARAGQRDVLAAVKTGFLVNPASRNPAGAVAFLQILLSAEVQRRFAALGALSLRREAASFTDDPRVQRMLEILAEARRIVPPPDAGYSAVQANVAYEAVGHVLTGKLDVDGAAAFWSAQKRELARKGL